MKSCAGRLRAVAVAKGPSQHEGKVVTKSLKRGKPRSKERGFGYGQIVPGLTGARQRFVRLLPIGTGFSGGRHILGASELKISFAFLVQSELSEYRKEGCPARRCRDNCLRLFRCWRWACRRRHTGTCP